jgi:hypothetical protein
VRIFPSKRTVKRWAIGAAILIALALIANGFMVWLTDHRLQTRIAAIRAAGNPASIADLAPKPIPDDQNAAVYLERLKPQLGSFSKDNARFLETSPVGKAFDERGDRGEPPTPEQIAAIRSILDKYPEIDAGLASAAACKQYASLANFTLGQRAFLEDLIDNRILYSRTAARFNDWRITVMIADGKAQEAAQLGLESLRLARLHDAEPLLVNYLLGLALRGFAAQDLYDAIAAGPISPQLHAAIDEELVEQDDPQRVVRALKSERAYCVALTASIGMDSSFDQANPILMKIVGWPMKRLYLGAVDSFDRVFPLATKPWNEIWRTLSPTNSALPPTGDGILADLLMPTLKATFQSTARDLATLRSLRIFNALRQYAEQNGHEARGLEDLSLPKEATIDPFSGEPLKLKHTDDGWIVYSVMDNGVDDGGDFVGMKDYGLAPPRYRATEKHEKSSDDEAPGTDQ